MRGGVYNEVTGGFAAAIISASYKLGRHRGPRGLRHASTPHGG